MKTYGFPWPTMLDCDKFPLDNDMCIASQSDKEADGELLNYVTNISQVEVSKSIKTVGVTSYTSDPQIRLKIVSRYTRIINVCDCENAMKDYP